MLGVSVVGVTLLSLVPLVAQAPRVDGLIERADAIVVAHVDALHPLRGKPEVALLSFDRVLFGKAEPTHAFVLPYTSKESEKTNAFVEGGRYVLFLQLPLVSALNAAQAKVAEARLPGAPLFTCWSDDVWPITGERVAVPDGMLPSNEPPGVEHSARGARAPEDALLDWLGGRISDSLPSIRVSCSGMSGTCWSFLIAPDGSIRGRGASAERLPPAMSRALWDLLEAERFYELPLRVGGSHGPDEPFTTLEVRRVTGRTEVIVFGDALDHLSPPERDAAERALRVLRALPIAEPANGAPKK